MKQDEFAKNVERLVDPVNVGSIHFLESLNRMLPKSIQKALVKNSSKKIPFMGFVVEPYSSFLCYEIKNIEQAKSLLPNGFSLLKTKIFTDDIPKYYCIFGCFRAHTSAFWGARSEFYIIAQDDKTGMLSWLIVDYDSNTISYDSKSGLKAPNSTNSVITINHRGKLFVDIKRNDKSRQIIFNIDTEKGRMQNLDQRLWLEGNLSIGYGSNFSTETADIFSLRFEPCEVEKALLIPQDSIEIVDNSWFPGLLNDKPSVVACFPYAQHFISDSPGHSSNIKNKNELIESIDKFDFKNISVLSVKSFKRAMLVNLIISFAITVTLIVLYITK